MPLSAGRDGKADVGDKVHIDRANSFLAFMSKWVGLGHLKSRVSEKISAKRICLSSTVHAPIPTCKVETEKIKSIDAFEFGSTTVVEHALETAACLADSICSDQAIYEFGKRLVTVTRVTNRIAVEDVIGTGSFAKVYRGYDEFDKDRIAIKVFDASEIASKLRLQENLGREIECLRTMSGHPNVVQLRGLLVTKDQICILTEFLDGEEFFSYISRRGPMSEQIARPLLCQLASTVRYLHDIGIVHRDLKLENLILVQSRENLQLKLIDFGLARDDANDVAVMLTRCGSQEYAAPEILLGRPYNPRLSDSWSFGVIMYTALVGGLPFSADAREGPSALAKKIVAGVFKLPEGSMSQEASKLIRSLLVVRPEVRPMLSTALETSRFLQFHIEL
jgi:tRNA A-37 threonylcarbamoyl transferase component Bud32